MASWPLFLLLLITTPTTAFPTGLPFSEWPVLAYLYASAHTVCGLGVFFLLPVSGQHGQGPLPHFSDLSRVDWLYVPLPRNFSTLTPAPL